MKSTTFHNCALSWRINYLSFLKAHKMHWIAKQHLLQLSHPHWILHLLQPLQRTENCPLSLPWGGESSGFLLSRCLQCEVTVFASGATLALRIHEDWGRGLGEEREWIWGLEDINGAHSHHGEANNGERELGPSETCVLCWDPAAIHWASVSSSLNKC